MAKRLLFCEKILNSFIFFLMLNETVKIIYVTD